MYIHLLLAVSLNGLNQFYQFLSVMTKWASFQGDIIPGILLLIYIVKAFDSISWMFIESVLDFFNFCFSIKQWAKTCNTNITSAVAFAFVLAGKPFSYRTN